MVAMGKYRFHAALQAMGDADVYLVEGAVDADVGKKASVPRRHDVPPIHGGFDEHAGTIHTVAFLVYDLSIYGVICQRAMAC